MSDALVLNQDYSPISVLPISAVTWQVAVRAMYLETVDVLHTYSDWEVHSPSITVEVPSVLVMKKYLHYQKRVVWSEHNLFLRDRYTCQYCNKVFPSQELTYDHVLPKKYGGQTTWDNIVSACSPCNTKKGHNRNIKPARMPYMPTYYELLHIRKEYPLVVPDESWVEYLNWSEKNIFVKGKSRNILQVVRAA